MTERKSRVLIAAVVALALCCAGLQYARQAQARAAQRQIDELCQSALSEAYNSFLAYQDSGEETSYLSGVSALHTFQTVYPLTNVYDSGFASTLSEAYLRLMLFRDLLDAEDINLLLEALAFLNDNYSDIDGYTYLSMFVHAELSTEPPGEAS